MVVPHSALHASRMARQLRPYLPGAFFHLTSRTQGHVRYFDDELCGRMVGFLADAARGCDARVFAYTIMRDHLHLVVQQGTHPLWRLMQPMMRRVALLVQRRYGIVGHVMEREYRAKICATSEHLRNAILYTHVNPVRANICSSATSYSWTSHGHYVADNAASFPAPDLVAEGLTLFATCEDRSLEQLRKDYLAFLEWRLARDEWDAAMEGGFPTLAEPRRPSTAGGDAMWSHMVTQDVTSTAATPQRSRPDLRDFVKHQLGNLLPGAGIDLLRYGSCSRIIVRARRGVIQGAILAGYTGKEIANFLLISESLVSKVARTMRDAR